MSAHPLRRLLSAGLALLPLVFVPGVAADDQGTAGASAPQPRADLQGDPLPDGVVARLGVDRMCQPGVQFLVFSPDGNTLAAVDEDGLRLWDVPTGREVRRFDAASERIPGEGGTPAAFSDDGKFVALICGARTLRVWEVATGRVNCSFEDVPIRASSLTFDPTGCYLAAGGCGLQVWDLKAGQALDPWPRAYWVSSLAFRAGGTRLVAVATDDKKNQEQKALFEFSVPEGKVLGRRDAALGDTEHGALGPGAARYVAPVGDEKRLRLLDAASGKQVWTAEAPAAPGGPCRFAHDGQSLTESSADAILRVWDASTGRVKHEIKSLPAPARNVALSDDGSLLAFTGPTDDALHLWDFRAGGKGKEMHAYAGHRAGPLTAAFSADGKRVFTAEREGRRMTPARPGAGLSMREWEPATGKELRATRKPSAGEVYCTCFSGDGRLLAVLLQDGTIHLWEAGGGKEIRWWRGPLREAARIGYPDGRSKIYYDPGVEAPVFSPDGKVLLAAGGRMIHRWNVETGAELSALKTPAGLENALCLPNPDGRALLVTEWGYDAKGKDACFMTLVDAATGAVVRTLWEGPGVPSGWGFSDDGRTLAVAEGAAVTLWETANGRSRGRLETGPDKPCGLAFSPDGRFLAVGGDRAACLWDLARGREVRRWKDFPGLVDSLAFSPDGAELALAGQANTALVCDAAVDQTSDAEQISKDDLERLWKDLAGADGTRAYRAVVRLAASSEQSAPFLKGRFRPAPDPNEQKIPVWIADLDDDEFETREAASRDLEHVGAQARPALERCLEGKPSPEVRVRVTQLLQKLEGVGDPPPPDDLVGMRVVEALENGRTPEARKALEDLAGSAAGDPWAREAKAVLERWGSGHEAPYRRTPFAERPAGGTLVIGQ